MKTLMINGHDVIGGAAKAAYRIHKGLQAYGIQSSMLVSSKMSNDPSVFTVNQITANINRLLDKVPLIFSTKSIRPLAFSPGWVRDFNYSRIRRHHFDILHLHWICGGLLTHNTLKKFSDHPVVWTLHDSWAFTGGCLLHGSCDRYSQSCGLCPLIHSKNKNDLSRWVWNWKKDLYDRMNMTVVAPSLWLTQCAQKSSLLGNKPIVHIPHGIDPKVFIPTQKERARKILGLPKGKTIILAGAVDLGNYYKGFDFLKKALKKSLLGLKRGSTALMTFGYPSRSFQNDLDIEYIHTGYVKDEARLALIYSASDVYVSASLTESFGLTLLEAMACGTPQVAFNIGGIPDIISHRETGYLARPLDEDDLACGITWIIEDEDRRQRLSLRSRERALARYSIADISRQYFDLYRRLAT